jgi:hypothetical protein
MKKSVLLVLAGGVLGGAITSQFPATEVHAGEVTQDRNIQPTQPIPAAVVTQIKAAPNGVIYRAYQWHNGPNQMDGKLTPTECPVRHLHLRCQWRAGAEHWTHESRTKLAPKTTVWSAPQE